MSFTVSMVGNVNNIWRNTLSSRSSLKRNRRMVVVKATEEDMDPDMFINPEMKKDRDQVVNLKIKKDEDEVAEFVALPKLSKNTTAYCRCWRSGIFPLCDASHVKHNRETGDNVGPVLLMK